MPTKVPVLPIPAEQWTTTDLFASRLEIWRRRRTTTGSDGAPWSGQSGILKWVRVRDLPLLKNLIALKSYHHLQGVLPLGHLQNTFDAISNFRQFGLSAFDFEGSKFDRFSLFGGIVHMTLLLLEFHKVAEHDNDVYFLLHHHPPKVFTSSRKRSLSADELLTLFSRPNLVGMNVIILFAVLQDDARNVKAGDVSVAVLGHIRREECDGFGDFGLGGTELNTIKWVQFQT